MLKNKAMNRENQHLISEVNPLIQSVPNKYFKSLSYPFIRIKKALQDRITDAQIQMIRERKRHQKDYFLHGASSATTKLH